MTIEEDIKGVAETLAKAQIPEKASSPKEDLVKALINMGPDAILEKSKTMTLPEKVTLISALKDVKKAVSFDDAYQGSYHKGKPYGGKPGYDGQGTVIQEDVLSDDADEKLVKPEAANHNHQGDQTPEGREENKVEDPKDKKKKKVKKSREEVYRSVLELCAKGLGEAEMVETLQKSGMDYSVVGDMIKFALMENSRKVEAPSMYKMDNPMFKAMSDMHSEGKSKDFMRGFGVAKGGMEPDELSKMLTHICGQGKPKMEKSADLYKAVYKMMRNGDSRDAIEKAHPNEDSSQISKMYDSMSGMPTFKGNPEESQSADHLDKLQADSTREDSDRPEDLKVEADSDTAQKKVDDLNQGGLKKSITWDGPNTALQVNRGGRNHHYSMEEMYKSSEVILTALKKLSKSQTAEPSKGVNSDIEAGLDALPCDVITKAALMTQDANAAPFSKTSFTLANIGDSLGMSEEALKPFLTE